MNNKIREFLSFQDFRTERGITVIGDREQWEIAVAMYLAGVASETFFPCEDKPTHPTVQ